MTRETGLIDRTPQYQAGWDCGWNGPNLINCNYRHFATPEFMKDWERGKRDAESKRKECA